MHFEAAFPVFIVPDDDPSGTNCKSVWQLERDVDRLRKFQWNWSFHCHSVAADIHRTALKSRS